MKYSFNLIMNHNKSAAFQKVIIRQFYMILFTFYLLHHKNITNIIIRYIVTLFFL